MATPETESLAEQYARLSREGVDRRDVDAALRALDVLISAFVLLVTLPVLALVTLVLLGTSGTPLLYRGLRVGRHGRIFHMFK
ncbi:MAG TPA: sugar transferase, partial [Gaiellaceae bacterium]|nr:sugar transferase [Gaiellaceae bacterium]